MIKLNGEVVEITKFPNHEVLIKDEIKEIKLQLYVIDFKFESNEDFINLMFLKKHLDSKSFNTLIILNILYMPYSRMDRTEGQTVFTLKYICEFINSLNFYRVYIDEPHSDVCIALLDRVHAVNQSKKLALELMGNLDFNNDNDYIVYPDAGACKRYSKQINYSRIITANKERDFATGKIKNLTLSGEIPDKPFRAMIVDDLCSGGRTFMLTANALKEVGATEIYLVVAHCENTILDGKVLKEDSPITRVYTTNSIIDMDKASYKLIIKKII